MNVIIHRPQHYCISYLRHFVELQYRAAPDEARNAAHRFFDAMDLDGDGFVDYHEFSSFFQSEGFPQQSCINLFRMLDGNGDHRLDFREVMTFYYMLKTGIGYYICNHCDACRQQQYARQPRYPPMPNYQIGPWIPRPNPILRNAFRTFELILGVAGLVVGLAHCSIM